MTDKKWQQTTLNRWIVNSERQKEQKDQGDSRLTEAIVSEALELTEELDSSRKIRILAMAIEIMQTAEMQDFFSLTLPFILKMAIEFDDSLYAKQKNENFLKKGIEGWIKLDRIVILQIMARAFLCCLPENNRDFRKLHEMHQSETESMRIVKAHKLICVLHYFERCMNNFTSNSLLIYRKVIQFTIPFENCLLGLSKVEFLLYEKMESLNGCLQLDFANSKVGGGILGNGCVQEEILFLICTELISSIYFLDGLGMNEAILFENVERFSSCFGYKDTFRWAGDFESSRKDFVVAMDAFPFRNRLDQFTVEAVQRECLKLSAGFDTKMEHLPVATGHWGCGIFKGDKQFKFLLQLLVASFWQRELKYCCFGDFQFKDEAGKFYTVVKDKSVCQLYESILWICQNIDNQIEGEIFKNVLQYLNK